MSGTRSLERLTHFRCGSCCKWWSIGDAPLDREVWFCPWCGVTGVFNVDSPSMSLDKESHREFDEPES